MGVTVGLLPICEPSIGITELIGDDCEELKEEELDAAAVEGSSF
jgi:hypothetical protein